MTCLWQHKNRKWQRGTLHLRTPGYNEILNASKDAVSMERLLYLCLWSCSVGMHWFSLEEVYGKTTQEANVVDIRIHTKLVQNGTQNWASWEFQQSYIKSQATCRKFSLYWKNQKSCLACAVREKWTDPQRDISQIEEMINFRADMQTFRLV